MAIKLTKKTAPWVALCDSISGFKVSRVLRAKTVVMINSEILLAQGKKEADILDKKWRSSFVTGKNQNN